MNNNILPSDEYTEYEGNLYVNPQKGLEESNAFIENLRNTQNAHNAEINAQTYNLGSAVPSNLGGLVGGEGYFTARYQTPQSVGLAANLRAAAQGQVMNEALKNEIAIQKQHYNKAYKNNLKKTSPTNNQPETVGKVEENSTDGGQSTYSGNISGVEGYYTTIGLDGRVHLVDMETGEETIIEPEEHTGGGDGYGWSGGANGGG